MGLTDNAPRPAVSDDTQTTVYLSLGSNIGNRADNCRSAIEALKKNAGTVLAVSPLYQTSPLEIEDQDWFINGAVKLQTGRDPFDLLAVLRSIERAAGREAGGIRFGPRILDMDIIFFGQAVIDTASLTVPHPRMHKRGFVLQPLCDIDPNILHPVFGQTVRQLLENLDDHSQKVLPYP